MRGLIFQFCALVVSTSGLYLFSFGISGPVCSYATSCMYTISGLSFARHSHRVVLHVQLRPIPHGRMSSQTVGWDWPRRGSNHQMGGRGEHGIGDVATISVQYNFQAREAGSFVEFHPRPEQGPPDQLRTEIFIIISSWLELLEFPSMSATSSRCSTSAPSFGRLPTRLPTWLDPTPLKP